MIVSGAKTGDNKTEREVDIMDTRKISGSHTPSDVAGNRGAGQTSQAGKVTSSAAGSSATLNSPDAKSGINVAVSPKARELVDARKRAFEIAKGTPDIRENRVADIKRQLQAGTYQVDPGKIADGIAREALLEFMAESDGKAGL